MTTQRPQHDREMPARATTARRPSRTRRLADWLRGTPRRRRGDNTAAPAAAPTVPVPWQIRQLVLRDYHAANLARARRGAEELVRAGFHTGAVPYGYRAVRVRAATGIGRARWRTRLVIEPAEATTVQMIFLWRGVEQLSCAEIRRRLTADGYPAPFDPSTGQRGIWTRAAVRTILRNPKYTGRQVWGRTHRRRRVPPQRWVWSPGWAHPALITTEQFAAAHRDNRLAVTTTAESH